MLELINSLTPDEDLRQDLWVAYLDGAPNNALPVLLASLSSYQHIEASFKQQIQSVISYPLADHHLSSLTDIQRIIVCLLMLGCDLSIISAYNGITEVKVTEILVALQEGKHGTEEKLKPR